ncbi:MAG: alpha/beta hydrolase family protein [Actinomycetota bacterium]|jgi:pimeloyl-ACP methyl ester carboxylesterase
MIATRRRRVWLALVVVLPLVVWVVPALRARGKAVVVLADASDVPFPRPFARDVRVEVMEPAPGVVGDLYEGGSDAPLLLFVPGATLDGRDDARVIEAATALAGAGRRVFVPELDLYERTFRARDVERLVASISALSSDDERIGVVGFSYGGSLALLAAQDPTTHGRIAYLATFGAYFDLLHLLQGVTTGSTILDGEAVIFPTVPEARDILTDATVLLASDRFADEVAGALDGDDSDDLSEGADAIVELLSNRDPRRTEELAGNLPGRFRATLDRFSPATAIEQLDAPLFILQSKKDAATPWTEAVLLERSVKDSRLVLLNHFSHVDPPGLGGWLGDGPKTWWWLSWVLAAQE